MDGLSDFLKDVERGIKKGMEGRREGVLTVLWEDGTFVKRVRVRGKGGKIKISEIMEEIHCDRRRPSRLKSKRLNLTLKQEGQIVFQGLTTGINENGLGARINPVHPKFKRVRDKDLLGRVFMVYLEIPGLPISPTNGEVIFVERCKDSEFKKFVAIRFLFVSPVDKKNLRDYIHGVQGSGNRDRGIETGGRIED